MNDQTQTLLIAAAIALTIGMLVTFRLVLRDNAERKRLSARLASVSNAEPRRARAQTRSIARAAVANRLSTRQRLAAQFGFDPDRTSHLPLRPWVVLVLTLIAARGLTMLTNSAFGDLSLLATPVVWVLLSRSTFATLDDRFSRILVKQFPDALQMIVRSVRVGIPVSEAIRLVGKEAPQPTANEFNKMAGEIAIGTTLEDAIKNMAARTGLAEYSFFATTITLQATTGGSLGETLEGLADVIRRRIALRAKGMAMASQARTSASVLIALPFLSGGGMYLLNDAYIGLLFSEALGRQMLGVAAASLIIGVLIMRTIIRRSLA